jgi:enterochelin esterase-like enzyme
VYLAGNLDELGPWRADGLLMNGQGGERVAHLRLPEGTLLEYKFTLGEWAREGLGPSGTVMPNNRLLVDGDEDVTIAIVDFKKDPREYIADWRNSGVIGRLDYWLDVRSQFLEAPRHVEIWLPPQYDAEPARRFPVLYMHDGQNLFDPRIANTGVDWGVDEAITSLVNEGLIEPAIVIGVWSTDQRRMEYAPAGVLARMSDEMKQAAASEFPEELRLGDNYIRFLAEELKPRVDAAYRTQTEREHTFLMGSSMGALISIYGLAERPDVFGAAAGLSMHWPVGVSEANFVEREAEWRPAIITAFERYFTDRRLDPETHRIWVDHGTGFLDHYYVRYQEAMLPVLTRLGYVEGDTLGARVYPGADHNEAAWRARLRDPLLFLMSRPAAAARR